MCDGNTRFTNAYTDGHADGYTDGYDAGYAAAIRDTHSAAAFRDANTLADFHAATHAECTAKCHTGPSAHASSYGHRS